MPSNYHRKPGSRRYVDYTKDELKECLAAVKSKMLTQRAAAKKYHIKYKDISNKSINLNENTILTENISTTKICENSAETWPRNDIVVNDYVLITWDSRKYPGKVVSISEEAMLVSCMKKGKSFWRWPAIKDEQLYNWADVNCKIAVPKFMQKGCFKIPELDD